MALKVNTKTDWGEMFDKFATVPAEEKKAGPDPKKQEQTAKKEPKK